MTSDAKPSWHADVDESLSSDIWFECDEGEQEELPEVVAACCHPDEAPERDHPVPSGFYIGGDDTVMDVDDDDQWFQEAGRNTQESEAQTSISLGSHCLLQVGPSSFAELQVLHNDLDDLLASLLSKSEDDAVPLGHDAQLPADDDLGEKFVVHVDTESVATQWTQTRTTLANMVVMTEEVGDAAATMVHATDAVHTESAFLPLDARAGQKEIGNGDDVEDHITLVEHETTLLAESDADEKSHDSLPHFGSLPRPPETTPPAALPSSAWARQQEIGNSDDDVEDHITLVENETFLEESDVDETSYASIDHITLVANETLLAESEDDEKSYDSFPLFGSQPRPTPPRQAKSKGKGNARAKKNKNKKKGKKGDNSAASAFGQLPRPPEPSFVADCDNAVEEQPCEDASARINALKIELHRLRKEDTRQTMQSFNKEMLRQYRRMTNTALPMIDRRCGCQNFLHILHLKTMKRFLHQWQTFVLERQ